jgi:quinoprotein glucose dehydrogenase
MPYQNFMILERGENAKSQSIAAMSVFCPKTSTVAIGSDPFYVDPGRVRDVAFAQRAVTPIDATTRRFAAPSNTMSLAHVVRLIPRTDYAAAHAAAPKAEIGLGLGTPYAAERTLLLGNAPPWGTLTAVDLSSGTIRWQIPLGSMAMGFIRGLPNLGGPIVTASGVVFIAASRDDKLRAFDVSTGKELWQASLPAGGQATPISYVAAGRQFVVIAAGGHSRLGSTLGDAVIAFSLPPATGSTIR